jgi:hypothetical protein
VLGAGAAAVSQPRRDGGAFRIAVSAARF